MRLKSASPFWPIKDGLVSNYRALDRDVSCDVAVVGGGLSGAMVAHHLAGAGADVVVLDKRDVGFGSTSSSTALVLYEIDMHLSDLIALRGERSAVRSYELCLQAVGKVERIMKTVGGGRAYEKRKSLYFADNEKEASILKKEYQTRRRFGFSLDYLDRWDIEKDFPFSKPAALLSHDAGQVDPYLMAHLLLDHWRGRGVRTYDRTAVTGFEPTVAGAILSTDRGFGVRAKKVVFATGFETTQFLKRKVVDLKSSYAIVTEPVPEIAEKSYSQYIMWEVKRPYLYLRTTSDLRMMIGGEDEDFVNPTRRDHLIPEKARTLLKKTQRLFPQLDLETAYAWAGTFGETADSLPYIGEVEEFPNAYFSLCYGANGTNFAVMGAEIICDMYLKRPNPDIDLFRFDR